MSLLARGLVVDLGRRRILHGVDLDAEPGGVTAVIGPNGSGKTTLMRALAGEVSHGGTVRLSGLDPARAHPLVLARIRAVLPQATPLAFPFTVLKVVRLGLSAQPAPDHAALAALDAVGLGEFGGRFFQELSGGEQQRAQLARVLAQVREPVRDGAPRWLFLDEPVASLDIAHQLQVMEVARRFAAGGGGVVAVMHDLNLTAMFADRAVLMAEGRIAAAGAVAAVMTDEALGRAYGCALRVNETPERGTFVLPHTAGGRAA